MKFLVPPLLRDPAHPNIEYSFGELVGLQRTCLFKKGSNQFHNVKLIDLFIFLNNFRKGLGGHTKEAGVEA